MMTNTYWFHEGGSRCVKLLTLSMDLFFEMLLGNVVCKAQPGPGEQLRAVELDVLPPGTEVQAVAFDQLRREVVLRLANPAWEEVSGTEPLPQLELIVRSRTFQVLDPSGAVLACPRVPAAEASIQDIFINLLNEGVLTVPDLSKTETEFSVLECKPGVGFVPVAGAAEQELEDFKREYERNLAAAIQANPLLAGRTCTRCQLATPPDQLHAHNEALLCGPCLTEVLK